MIVDTGGSAVGTGGSSSIGSGGQPTGTGGTGGGGAPTGSGGGGGSAGETDPAGCACALSRKEAGAETSSVALTILMSAAAVTFCSARRGRRRGHQGRDEASKDA